MIKILLSLALLMTVAFISCDPVRRIDMKNKTGDSVEIIWSLEEIDDSLVYNPFFISNSKELSFKLYPPKNNEVKMSFGAGSWSPKEVERLVRNLKSLEIISGTQRIKIDSLPLLKDYLLARRKGLGGARIEIVVTRN